MGHFIAVERWTLLVILGLVAAQRFAELVLSQRNGKRLLARGGHEVGAGHYPLMVGVHVLWLAALAGWAMLAPPRLSVPLIIAYGLVQVLRVWVMASLGPYWTTRIITVPGAPLVRTGPYRFLRHPNYAVVTLELAILPLAFGAWPIAAVFTLLNALALWVRIGAENAALAPRAS